MSTCISKHGEFSEHEPGDWCPRCWAFNEEAIVAERDELRAKLAEATTVRTVGELTAKLDRVRDLADWHETKAMKARRFPGEGSEALMEKAAQVHDDSARRIREALGADGGE